MHASSTTAVVREYSPDDEINILSIERSPFPTSLSSTTPNGPRNRINGTSPTSSKISKIKLYSKKSNRLLNSPLALTPATSISTKQNGMLLNMPKFNSTSSTKSEKPPTKLKIFLKLNPAHLSNNSSLAHTNINTGTNCQAQSSIKSPTKLSGSTPPPQLKSSSKAPIIHLKITSRSKNKSLKITTTPSSTQKPTSTSALVSNNGTKSKHKKPDSQALTSSESKTATSDKKSVIDDYPIDDDVYSYSFSKKDLTSALSRLLKKLFRKDSYAMFWEPVETDLVADYLDVIKTPMDLGTMKANLETHSYKSFSMFIDHFELICSNAMIYNTPSTIYYQHAMKFLEAGRAAIAKTARKLSKLKATNYPLSQVEDPWDLPIAPPETNPGPEPHKAPSAAISSNSNDLKHIEPTESNVQILSVADIKSNNSNTTPNVAVSNPESEGMLEITSLKQMPGNASASVPPTNPSLQQATSSPFHNKLKRRGMNQYTVNRGQGQGQSSHKKLKSSKFGGSGMSSKRSKQSFESFSRAMSSAPNNSFAYLRFVDKTQTLPDGSLDLDSSEVLQSILSNCDNYYNGYSFDPLVSDASKSLVSADNWRLLRDSDFVNYPIVLNPQHSVGEQRRRNWEITGNLNLDVACGLSTNFGLASVFGDKLGLSYYISVIQFLGTDNPVARSYIQDVFNYLSQGAYDLYLRITNLLNNTSNTSKGGGDYIDRVLDLLEYSQNLIEANQLLHETLHLGPTDLEMLCADYPDFFTLKDIKSSNNNSNVDLPEQKQEPGLNQTIFKSDINVYDPQGSVTKHSSTESTIESQSEPQLQSQLQIDYMSQLREISVMLLQTSQKITQFQSQPQPLFQVLPELSNTTITGQDSEFELELETMKTKIKQLAHSLVSDTIQT